ncbi:WD40 repeat-like protein [Vararia minispora EC-137]|uniref:WD40 repeat-like protein n=1 Tax=Vararia minispora EC-137 TaxID=1314806 RepID=A0ACB8QYR6_9AGAM|nr:WD40 repeat-like protein [Vararia minispora EC-137]
MPDSFFATKTRKRKRDADSASGPKKSARKNDGSRKAITGQPKLRKGRTRAADEELGSEGSSGDVDDMDLRAQEFDSNESGEEDEDETPAEKRLRLAKLYLESIKEGLAEGEVDAAEIDRELISQRLQKDVMEHTGKMHLFVADTYDYHATPTWRTRGHRFTVTSAVASDDARVLFTAGKEGSIIKWDLRTGKRLATFPKIRLDKGKGKARESDLRGHTDEVWCLALGADTRYLASGGKDRRVCVWDVEKGQWVKTFSGHRDSISSLAFRKSSQQLYTASYDRTIKLFDLGVMGYVETLFGHQDYVLALDALRAETAVSVGGRDKTARFWKIADESQLVFRGGGRSAVRELLEGGALEGLEDEVEKRPAGMEKRFIEGSLDCVAMIDESTFLSGGDSGSICLWMTQKKKPIFTQAIAHGFHETLSETEGLIQTPRWVTALGTLRYSDLFASGSWEGNIRLWKLDAKLKFFELVGTVRAPGVVNSLQFVITPKGWIGEASWAQRKPPEGTGAVQNKSVSPLALLVAGLGQETRLGRWITVKGDGSQNQTIVYALHPRTPS